MNSLVIYFGLIGMPQVIIIIVVILLLFGGRKIPELMRALGSGIKEFKNAAKEESEEKVRRKKITTYRDYVALKKTQFVQAN